MKALKCLLAVALCSGLGLGFAFLGCGDTQSNCERACTKIHFCWGEGEDRDQYIQDCTFSCIDDDALEGCEAVCDSSPNRPCEDFGACLDVCQTQE